MNNTNLVLYLLLAFAFALVLPHTFKTAYALNTRGAHPIPADAAILALPTRSLIPVANHGNGVTPQSTKARRLVVFLHGLRGSGSVMAAIGSSWKSSLTDTKFVSPDAPFASHSGGREWFGVDDQVLRPDRIQAARRSFDDLVGDIVKREGFENDLEDVAFVGVSQGAIMGLDAVATGRWQVGAMVSFAGLLPLPPKAVSGPKTSVLLLHGSADQTIPSAASLSAASQLKSAGYNVAVKIYPGVGHTISAEEAQEALEFLRTPLNR